jgi:hypothetical protein
MKIRSLALLTVIIFIASCAGGPGVREEAPEWVGIPPADTDTAWVFRGTGTGDTLTASRTAAIRDLESDILEQMNLGSPEDWNSDGRSAIDSLFDKLERMIGNPETSEMEGVELLNREGWKNAEGTITYAVEIAWDMNDFDRQVASLAELIGFGSAGFKEMEVRARAAEDDGNIYEAALIWAAAAGIAERNGNQTGYRNALMEVVSLLKILDFEVVSVPEQVYVGSRPGAPVLFSVSAGGKPVGNAEFLIMYPRNARNGSPVTSPARVLSDSDGIVRFLPPEVPFAGVQAVTISPSADPFLEYLSGPGDRYSDELIDGLEIPRAEAEYEALPVIRSIPIGIVILETDLAGNALNTTDAARGVLDDLVADGFNIEVMNLNPGEMLARTEAALLRDLKADENFADVYSRVIHGTVALESFEQNGDSFTVRVSGTLALSDIQRQVTLYRSEITKTSRAAGSQQAISAAFRQLGRSFAGELIQQAP